MITSKWSKIFIQIKDWILQKKDTFYNPCSFQPEVLITEIVFFFFFFARSENHYTFLERAHFSLF